MTIQYDPRLGQYRGDRGRIIPRSQIERLVRDEGRSLNNDLQRLHRSYQGTNLSLLRLQQRSAELIRAKSIELGLLAVGGKAQLANTEYKQQVYGQIGQNVRRSLEALQRNIVAIANNEISPRMAAFRFKQIAASAVIGHYTVEKTAREHEGFNFGARQLEPGAKHCKSCPSYSTDGLFVPIEQIITPGRLCECGGFCKCKVKYKKDYRETKELTIPDEKFAAQNFKKLGEGAYGTVYRDGNIAYKYLKADQNRFISNKTIENEVRLTKRASDLGVAPTVLGFTKTAFAQNYLAGYKTFSDLEEFADLPNGRAIISNYVQSMRRLHENGIAHLDAHQYNIMANEQGQVRIIDFGLADDSNPHLIVNDIERIKYRSWMVDTVDGAKVRELVDAFENDHYQNPDLSTLNTRVTRFYDNLEQLNLTPTKFGPPLRSQSFSFEELS